YVLDRVTGRYITGIPFVKQLNWASGLTPEGRPIRVPGIVPTLGGTKTCPATAGATNWMSPAYSPETRLFYVVAQEGCGINTKSSDTFRPGGFPFMATGYIESPEEPWQMHVRALEVATGKLVWDYPQISSKRYGAGLLSTGGGLLFAGDDRANSPLSTLALAKSCGISIRVSKSALRPLPMALRATITWRSPRAPCGCFRATRLSYPR